MPILFLAGAQSTPFQIVAKLDGVGVDFICWIKVCVLDHLLDRQSIRLAGSVYSKYVGPAPVRWMSSEPLGQALRIWAGLFPRHANKSKDGKDDYNYPYYSLLYGLLIIASPPAIFRYFFCSRLLSSGTDESFQTG